MPRKPTRNKRLRWLLLQSRAFRHHGLARDAFLRLTLPEWQGLEQDYDSEQARWHELPAATVAAVVANANRDSKKRARPFSAADFSPWLAARRAQQGADPREISQFFHAFRAAQHKLAAN